MVQVLSRREAMKNIKVKTTLLMKAIIVTLALTGGNGWALALEAQITSVNTKGTCTCQSLQEVKIIYGITESECTESKCESFLKDGDKTPYIVKHVWT
jgi:hypothetical protein